MASGALRHAKALWEHGIVYVHLQPGSFTTNEVFLIRDAMNHIEDSTGNCVRFIPATNLSASHVLLRKADVCEATVGRSVLQINLKGQNLNRSG